MANRTRLVDQYGDRGKWEWIRFDQVVSELYAENGIGNANQLKKLLGCSNDRARVAFSTPREMTVDTFELIKEKLSLAEKEIEVHMWGWLEGPIDEAEKEYPQALEKLVRMACAFLMHDAETQEHMIRILETFEDPNMDGQDPYFVACRHLWGQVYQLKNNDPHMTDWILATNAKAVETIGQLEHS